EKVLRTGHPGPAPPAGRQAELLLVVPLHTSDPILQRRYCAHEPDEIIKGGLSGKVAAAGQEQPVESLRERFDVVLLRQVDRNSARLRYRGRVGGVRVVIFAPRPPAAALVETRRNADERPHRAKYTFGAHMDTEICRTC